VTDRRTDRLREPYTCAVGEAASAKTKTGKLSGKLAPSRSSGSDQLAFNWPVGLEMDCSWLWIRKLELDT